eukprot:CAMPEP_0167788632 /NCGR_PEP_ID=MMETSP0111_2-20121227/10158_1 /TAXON_ID=91324 /ORGANISM="Lotharella globosa, Strain CCCM811" /LENGTH=263 /DNA_ID=CAMNT_0007680551 /DNA_START=148 /DNA_END=942 /DNA_ORIENTATION=-
MLQNHQNQRPVGIHADIGLDNYSELNRNDMTLFGNKKHDDALPKSVEIARGSFNPLEKKGDVKRSAPADGEQCAVAVEVTEDHDEGNGGEYNDNLLYTTLKQSDFEVEEPATLNDLLKRTGAWYPEMDRKEAERAVASSLRSEKNASHVYLFRRSSSVKPEAKNEEVFVLTEGTRQGFVTHYILVYTEGKVRFKPGNSVPAGLSNLIECRDVTELLGRHLSWDNPIPVSSQYCKSDGVLCTTDDNVPAVHVQNVSPGDPQYYK